MSLLHSLPRSTRSRVGGRIVSLSLVAAVALGVVGSCVDRSRPVGPASGAEPGPGVETRRSALVVDDCSGVADLALCNDKNPCTIGDRCLGGLCLGTPAADGTTCTDGNQCTSGDRCSGGVCSGLPVVEGAACTDGEPCTSGDSCRLGVCTASGTTICDDGLVCTVDRCEPGQGCVFQAIPECPAGDGAAPGDATPPGPDLSPATDGGPSSDGGSASDRDASPPGEAGSDIDGADGRVDAPPDGLEAADKNDDVAPADGAHGGDADADADAVAEDDAGGEDGDAGLDGMEDGGAFDGPAADDRPVSFNVHGGACSCQEASSSVSGGAWLLLASISVSLAAGRRSRKRRQQRP